MKSFFTNCEKFPEDLGIEVGKNISRKIDDKNVPKGISKFIISTLCKNCNIYNSIAEKIRSKTCY